MLPLSHRRAVVAPLLSALVGCSAAPSDTTTTPVPAVASSYATPEPPPPSPYRLRVPPSNLASSTRVELDGDRTGLILGGRRVVVTPRSAVTDGAPEPVTYVRVIRTTRSNGTPAFLFTATDGLYVADTFDGPTRALASGGVTSVSAARGIALFVRDDGTREAIELETGRPTMGLPLGAAKLAADASGRVGLLAEGGRAFVADGPGWVDVTAKIPLPISDVLERGGAVYFHGGGFGAARLDASGPTLASLPIGEAPAPQIDPRWRVAGTPLEVAVTTGAPWKDDLAIAARAGSVYVISTTNGAVVDVEDGVVPPDANCEATRLSDRVVFLCHAAGIATAYSRSFTADAKTQNEHTFLTDGAFVRGAGDALLFRGMCGWFAKTVSRVDAIACVRDPKKGWVELDRSGEVSDTPPGQPLRIAAWIPKADGAVVVLGGKDGGLMDATTGARAKLSDEKANALEALFQANGRLIDDYGVLDDGSIVGMGRDRVSFRVSDQGNKIERSPFRMVNVASSGEHALARASSAPSTLWLSSDYGFTFTEIAGTPLANESPSTCSAVGCAFSTWLRIGWELGAPSAPPPPRSAVAPTRAASDVLPLLSCSSTGAMARKAVTPGGARMGFGAEAVRDDTSFLGLYPRGGVSAGGGAFEALNLRAALTGKVPRGDSIEKPSAAFTESRRLRYVEPFDGKGTIRETSLRLSDLFDAARRSGGTLPDPSATDDRGSAIVVGSRGDDATVLVTSTSLPLIWARGAEKPLVLSAGTDAPDLTAQSAVRTGPDAITVLFAEDSGGSHVRTLGPGRTDELFTIPAPPDSTLAALTPDTIAVDDDGKIGIIRVLSSTAPTVAAPALLLTAGASPVALAPWSTATDARAPECATSGGFHAVVTTREPWFRFGAPPTDGQQHITIAKVRWGRDRVCVEAIETSAVTHDLPEGLTVESYVAAKFTKDASAGHVMVAEGAELREPRTCSLASSPPPK